MSGLPIEEFFKYHPPQTEERQQKHDAVNAAALQFAKIVEASVKDEDYKKMARFSIEQAMMYANKGITIDSLVSGEEA